MQLTPIVPNTVEEMSGPSRYVCVFCMEVFTQGISSNEDVRRHSNSLGHLVRALIKDKLYQEGDIPQTQEELRREVSERQSFHISMRKEN